MKTNSEKAAFPVSMSSTDDFNEGITKREYLVFQIYKESVSISINNVDTFKAFAKNSIAAADILFEELNKS